MLEPGIVLYLSGEDGAADTLKPRFIKQGGDASRFYVVDGLIEEREDGQRRSRFLLKNLELLEDGIRKLQPVLVVIDPIQAFIGGKVDLHRANETREALEGISKLAERYGFALLLVCQLNKASQSKAIYRVLGSIDIVAGARSVLLAGPHPDGSHAVVHLKCSVGPKGPTLLYCIDHKGLHWTGTDRTTAAELLEGTAQPRPKTNAQKLLADLLSAGPKSADEVFALASQNGIADGSMRAAGSYSACHTEAL
jgi:hypothetical protein